ncbi:canalicular multispecific organic anion transporter 1, partial [Elysia marginata]
FSRDVDTVDNAIPLIIRDFLITACIILFTLIVILVQSPIFGAVLIPIVVVFMIIQNYYVRTSRQLKRIESIARSPIYVHFSESVTGAAVIRAYGATERFMLESERRVDRNQVYYFASQAAIR